MLFKGTSEYTAAQLAERMDAVGGQINAYTTRDNTCFYARVLDTHLPLAIDTLCAMFFDSKFDEADVENEKGIIQEEIDMYEDTPEDVAAERLIAGCFPGALGRPVLGRASSLSRQTGETLRGFMRRHYTAPRIVAALSGSFTDADVRDLCERFSVLPKSRAKAPAQIRLHALSHAPAQGHRAEPARARLPRPGDGQRRPLHHAAALRHHRRQRLLPPVPDRAREVRPVLLRLLFHCGL